VVLKIILDILHNLRFGDEYKEELLKPLHGIFSMASVTCHYAFNPIAQRGQLLYKTSFTCLET
jgi:hypothetical protein